MVIQTIESLAALDYPNFEVIVIDNNTKDPAVWRPVQDCTHGYGTGIALAEVVHLDYDGFEQEIHTVLRPNPNWPGRRLHTLNRAGWLECIDGSASARRF